MRRVGVVKNNYLLLLISLLLHVVSLTACKNEATSTKRWAPLSPPDEFDVADAKWTPALVLVSGGARGGRGGG